jgi:hypothetical protein
MRWFRSNVRLGSYLALLALTVQLALSFAHVHLDGIGSRAAGTALSLLKGTPAAALPDAPAAPSKHGSGGLADDFCAVCSLVQMAGSSVPAASPALPLPGPSSQIWRATRAEFRLAASRQFPFQARAPPLA